MGKGLALICLTLPSSSDRCDRCDFDVYSFAHTPPSLPVAAVDGCCRWLLMNLAVTLHCLAALSRCTAGHSCPYSSSSSSSSMSSSASAAAEAFAAAAASFLAFFCFLKALMWLLEL